MRILPHEANIAPVAAIALFSGAYLDKKIGPWVPLLIMMVSDLIIGLHGMVLYTWGAFFIIGCMGIWLKERRTPVNIFGAAVFSSILFFTLTNFGVWINWYPHTVAGITDCYVKAIPFFRNSLISNIIFSLVFFGIYEEISNKVGNFKIRTVLIGK
jgi:hypothetical protein